MERPLAGLTRAKHGRTTAATTGGGLPPLKRRLLLFSITPKPILAHHRDHHSQGIACVVLGLKASNVNKISEDQQNKQSLKRNKHIAFKRIPTRHEWLDMIAHFFGPCA